MQDQAADALAWKREAIGRLASGMVHTFNNRLQDLVGNIEMAADDLPPDSPGHACIEQAIEAAMRAAEVAESVLNFSHGPGLGIARTDLRGLLADLHRLLTRTATSATSIELAPVPDLPTVLVDADRFRTLMIHLALDAALGLRRGGVVRLAAQAAAAKVIIAIRRAGEPSGFPLADGLARACAFAPGAGAEVRAIADGVEIGLHTA